MDIVENRKPKLTRVSFKVAEKASSDGATNKQCLIDDQKDTKTTITKLPTDLVDIPKPTLSWVSVQSINQSIYSIYVTNNTKKPNIIWVHIQV